MTVWKSSGSAVAHAVSTKNGLPHRAICGVTVWSIADWIDADGRRKCRNCMKATRYARTDSRPHGRVAGDAAGTVPANEQEEE